MSSFWGPPPTKHISEARPFYFNYIKQDLLSDRKVVVVVTIKDDIVGMVIGKIEKSLRVMRHTRVGHITGLYVLPKYRKKEVASGLVSETISWFQEKEVNHYSLEVYNKNLPALALFKKMGFKECIVKMKKKV